MGAMKVSQRFLQFSLKKFFFFFNFDSSCQARRRHDTQNNDTWLNDTQPYQTQKNGFIRDIQHNDTQHKCFTLYNTHHNDTQHNNTQHNHTYNVFILDTQHQATL